MDAPPLLTLLWDLDGVGKGKNKSLHQKSLMQTGWRGEKPLHARRGSASLPEQGIGWGVG